MNIPLPGIYPNFSELEYHNDPCPAPSLSSTIAKKIVAESAMHAYAAHPKLGAMKEDGDEEADPETTKAKILGQLVHKLMLGRGSEIVVIDADSYRTALAKSSRDLALAHGKIPVLKHKLPDAQMAADEARRQLDAMGLTSAYREGQNEVVLVWQEDGGIWMRAMLDNLQINENNHTAKIRDLKTVSRSSHPEACAAQISKMAYDISAAFYERGLTVLRPDLAGRIEFEWDFLEVNKPYQLTPVTISAEWKMAAEMRCEKAVAKWRECLSTGIWPFHAEHTVRLEPRPWDVVKAFTDE